MVSRQIIVPGGEDVPLHDHDATEISGVFNFLRALKAIIDGSVTITGSLTVPGNNSVTIGDANSTDSQVFIDNILQHLNLRETDGADYPNDVFIVDINSEIGRLLWLDGSTSTFYRKLEFNGHEHAQAHDIQVFDGDGNAILQWDDSADEWIISTAGSAVARFTSSGLTLEAGDFVQGVRARGWSIANKTSFSAVDTMEVWGSAQNLGIFPTGHTFWVSAQLAGSILTAAGIDKSGRVRVGISEDGGSTWDYGPSNWCSAVQATRRSACVASHGVRVTADGANNIQVRAEALISGGATTDIDFVTGNLTAQMAPDA